MKLKLIHNHNVHLLITLICVIFSIEAYGQYLPLAGGTTTGTVAGPNFIQTGGILDLAPSSTFTTNGTNYGGGAINRSFGSFTGLNSGQYILLDFGSALPVGVISFGTYWSDDARFIPLGFTINYSADNINWTPYVAVTNNSNANPVYLPNISARYWKLTVTATQSGFSVAHISGLQFIALGIGSAGSNYWNSWYGSNSIFTNTPVTIGATADMSNNGYMLSVNGSVLATSVQVQSYNSWPDYVFKPTYSLPTLSEVKTYIDQNHHLPEIPTSEQIEKDGLNLGEMNKLLVKKVEELTLYLIEKDKKEKEQRNQLDEQKEQLAVAKSKLKEQEDRLVKLEKQLEALLQK
jgi:hypothetical protein